MWWPSKSARRQLEASPTSINGLPLPSDLLSLIEAGRWLRPADLSGVDRLFPDRGEFKLYSLDYMAFENRHWLAETSPMFLGSSDPVKSPGEIDPKLSILIGDLGIGYDQPIALDYRPSAGGPSVLTLEWSAFARNNRWVEVACNIGAFAKLVGL